MFKANSVLSTNSNEQCDSNETLKTAGLNVKDCNQVHQNRSKSQRSNYICNYSSIEAQNRDKKSLLNGPGKSTCCKSISRLPKKQQSKASCTIASRKLKQNPPKASQANACSSKNKCITKHNENLRKYKLSQKCSTSKNSSTSTFQRKISTVSCSANKKSQPQRLNKRLRPSCVNNPKVFDGVFQFNLVVQEIFKVKIYSLDIKKYQAYKLWLQYIHNQLSEERVKEIKKLDIIKTFVVEDEVLSLCKFVYS